MAEEKILIFRFCFATLPAATNGKPFGNVANCQPIQDEHKKITTKNSYNISARNQRKEGKRERKRTFKKRQELRNSAVFQN